MRSVALVAGLAVAALGAGGRLAAQEHGATAQSQVPSNQIDIMHHLADSPELETPFGVIHLPQ